MYGAFIRAGIELAFAVFIAMGLSYIITPIVDVMQAGDHAGDADMVIGFFTALTEQNLILVFALSLVIWLIGRASIEANLGGA